jgi:hypothetical protein
VKVFVPDIGLSLPERRTIWSLVGIPIVIALLVVILVQEPRFPPDIINALVPRSFYEWWYSSPLSPRAWTTFGSNGFGRNWESGR